MNLAKYNIGYMAEAYVVNKGITFEWGNLKDVASTQRVQLNENMQEIGKKINVDYSTPQFSTPGLYHYIITLKDKVNQKVDPREPQNSEVKAEQGTTLHKLIYISDDVKDYSKFLDLDFIKKNTDIFDFLTSIQGNHLVYFLLKNNFITSTKELQEMNYYGLVKYWKMYVSAIKLGIQGVPDTPAGLIDLNKLNTAAIKLGAITDKNIAIIQIRKKINEKIIALQTKSNNNEEPDELAIEGIDYEVIGQSGKELEELEFTDFLVQDGNWHDLKLTIRAKASAVLVGQTNILARNNSEYNPDLSVNIADVPFADQEYNFTYAPDAVKRNFKYNYITNLIRRQLNEFRPDESNHDYSYLEDFIVYLNEDKVEMSNLEDLDTVLELFLTSEFKIELTINVLSHDDSLYTEGQSFYKIINDPFSENIAPEEPPIIEEPGDNEIIDETKKPLEWWIILIIVLSLCIAAAIIAILVARRKRKKIKK